MAQLGDISNVGGERIDAIDHCLAGISRLQKEVQDAASYLTAYDQRTYSEVNNTNRFEVVSYHKVLGNQGSS